MLLDHPTSEPPPLTTGRRGMLPLLGAGALGGLVVAAAAAALVATGAIGPVRERDVVHQVAAAPSGAPDLARHGLSINAIYRHDSAGVVFVQSRIVKRVASPFLFGPTE